MVSKEKGNFANPHTLPPDYQHLFNGSTVYELMNNKVGLEKTTFGRKTIKGCF